MTDFYLIITAGGIGKRFGKPYPKQFEKIGDKTIIELTLSFFNKIKPEFCVLTYPKGFEREFGFLKEKAEFPLFLVEGGEERFYSVKKGFEFLKEKADKNLPVLIHDGVRPFLKVEVIKEIIEKTKEKGAAVPYIPVSGTIRRVKNNEFYRTVDRTDISVITTPQGAMLDIFDRCFSKADKPYTDESTMLSDFGVSPFAIKDWYFNIKITNPEDKIVFAFLFDFLKK